MSLFFVDSNCDLGCELIGKLSAECIDFGKVDTPSDSQSKCKAICEKDYYDIFSQCFDRGDDVAYAFASQKIYNIQNLEKAKDKLSKNYPDRKLQLIDTNSFSIGQGLISYALALEYRNGASVDELKDISEKIKSEYQVFIAVDSINNLINNKLLDGKASVGASLNIKNIISIGTDGRFEMLDKVSGKKKSMNRLVEYINELGSNVVDYPIAIVYTREDEAEELRAKVTEALGEDTQILMERFTPNNLDTLGTNGVGICFHTRKRVM